MKKLFIPLSLFLLVACGPKSQKAPETETQGVEEAQEAAPKGPLAQIEFPEGTEYNVGTYYEKVDKTHDFLVRNPGKTPLIINKVETACSCTQATAPQNPILEGQTDTIHVRYNGNGFLEGYWIKSIYVYANIKENHIELQISGTYLDKKE